MCREGNCFLTTYIKRKKNKKKQCLLTLSLSADEWTTRKQTQSGKCDKWSGTAAGQRRAVMMGCDDSRDRDVAGSNEGDYVEVDDEWHSDILRLK